MIWANWLPLVIPFAPIVGVIVLLFLPREKTALHRGVGIFGTLLPLALALAMFRWFDPSLSGYQGVKSFTWFHLPIFDVESTVRYSVGVDGLSLSMVVLTAIITTLAAVASRMIKQRTIEYYVWLLILEVGMLGVFVTTNLFAFFIFFEITLIAMFFLVGIWGYLEKEKAANLFLLYNGLGSAFMLFAIIGLFVLFNSFDVPTIQQGMDMMMQQLSILPPLYKGLFWAIFISLIIAFGIKLPIFPFHTWMLRVHVEAPTPVVMIHSGVLLKMGAYGLIRFGVGIFPDYIKQIAFYLALLGLINILYGALLAFVEKELKKVLAYSSISHMGIILFGIASLNEWGLEGAIFQAVSHGLISALLFYLVGVMAERTKTTQLDALGGLSKSMPILSGFWLVGAMALLGLPGMSGFISEFFAFVGLYHVQPVIAVLGVLGIILAAAYSLRAVMKMTFGPIKERFNASTDVKWFESVPMWILTGLIVVIGVYPAILDVPLNQALSFLVSRIGG